MRLLVDEDFNNDLMRGLSARAPETDLIRVQDFVPGISDDRVLQWAFDNRRLLLTHDMKSMPRHCQHRWANGLSITGIIYVDQIINIGPAIERILFLLNETTHDDWVDRTEYVTRASVSAS